MCTQVWETRENKGRTLEGTWKCAQSGTGSAFRTRALPNSRNRSVLWAVFDYRHFRSLPCMSGVNKFDKLGVTGSSPVSPTMNKSLAGMCLWGFLILSVYWLNQVCELNVTCLLRRSRHPNSDRTLDTE